jgi:hypothetical protein
LYKTKTALNELLARDSSTNFTVAEEIAIDNQLLLPELINLAEKQNFVASSTLTNGYLNYN